MRLAHEADRSAGMVLITTLLLLLVVTILALAMFRGVGLENRIAGNTLDKQRALQGADSAQQYAEQWLISNIESVAPIDCSTDPAATAVPVICNQPLVKQVAGGQVANPPWSVSGTTVGFPYNPNNALSISSTGGVNSFYQAPAAYIGELGEDATDPNATDYIVDAWSYGGSQSTVAVVESVYQISLPVASATNP
ncbi:MAG: PilX N-terminal domain-containing pilus assembly protein [Pseudomonadota bacterium]|jgi:type IV pilus assembly protein PilX|nr:PilX N-terminal domain-containing pilus assembly protein [Pseudomonadota bacterium]